MATTTTWPKRCALCGREYTREEFLALSPTRGGGDQWAGGEHYFVRDCTCRNTMYAQDDAPPVDDLPEDDDEEAARADDAYAHWKEGERPSYEDDDEEKV